MKNKFLFLITLIFINACSCSAKNIDDKTLDENILSQIINGCLQVHVNKKTLTPVIAQQTLSNFVDSLDYSRLFFHESDVSAILANKIKFPKFYADSQWPLITNTYNLFLTRVDEQFTNAMNYLKNPNLKLEKERKIYVDPKERGFPKNKKEAKKIIENTLQYQLAYLVAIGEPLTGAVQKVIKRRERLTKRYHDFDHEKQVATFLNAFCNALDPHSNYLSRDDLEDFQINMSLSLEGIGALLGYEEGVTEIKSLTPGGPAEKSGLLKPNDKIVAVAQGKDGQFVDIIDMDLRDVVKLIRGKKGTIVKLKIVRHVGDGIEKKIISIKREKVNLEDQAARMEYVDVVKTNNQGKIENLRVAIIDLPSFYVDNKPRTFFQKPGRSAVADMRELLEKCNDDQVDGVILDLQRNGGGALDEAVDVAGLFLAKGNIVIATDRRKKKMVLSDTDSDLIFKGPVIITTSPLTASGAEIVAGALKDYNRALIVGAKHSYGKGTIQQVVPLSDKLGALKITIGEYFIADGKPTQINGVKSDIVLPNALEVLEIGEKFTPNPLPARTLPNSLTDPKNSGASPDGWRMITADVVSNLLVLSKQRVGASKSFKEVEEAIAKAEKQKEEKLITISSLLENVKGDNGKTNKNDKITNPYNQPLTNDVVVSEALNIMTDWLTGAEPKDKKIRRKKELVAKP